MISYTDFIVRKLNRRSAVECATRGLQLSVSVNAAFFLLWEDWKLLDSGPTSPPTHWSLSLSLSLAQERCVILVVGSHHRIRDSSIIQSPCLVVFFQVGLTALASPSRLIIATLYCPKRRLYLSRGGFTKESHLLFDIDKKLIWHHQDNNSFGVASPSDVASSLQQG